MLLKFAGRTTCHMVNSIWICKKHQTTIYMPLILKLCTLVDVSEIFWSSEVLKLNTEVQTSEATSCVHVVWWSLQAHHLIWFHAHTLKHAHTQLQVKNQEPVVSSKLVIRVQFVNDRWIFSVAHIYVIKSPLSSKPTKKFHSNFFYLLVSGQCDVTVTGPSLACIIFGVH